MFTRPASLMLLMLTVPTLFSGCETTDKMLGEIHYLNSGDWVESMTAIIEHFDGRFEVISYDEFCRRTHREPKEALQTEPV